MSWEFNSNTAIYLQIISKIKYLILSGEIKLGEKLPSVREFAEIANVNPNTMQKALQELEKQQLVYTERTSGKYVTEDNELINELREEIIRIKTDKLIGELKLIGFTNDEILKFISTYLKEGI